MSSYTTDPEDDAFSPEKHVPNDFTYSSTKHVIRGTAPISENGGSIEIPVDSMFPSKNSTGKNRNMDLMNLTHVEVKAVPVNPEKTNATFGFIVSAPGGNDESNEKEKMFYSGDPETKSVSVQYGAKTHVVHVHGHADGTPHTVNVNPKHVTHVTSIDSERHEALKKEFAHETDEARSRELMEQMQLVNPKHYSAALHNTEEGSKLKNVVAEKRNGDPRDLLPHLGHDIKEVRKNPNDPKSKVTHYMVPMVRDADDPKLSLLTRKINTMNSKHFHPSVPDAPVKTSKKDGSEYKQFKPTDMYDMLQQQATMYSDNRHPLSSKNSVFVDFVSTKGSMSSGSYYVVTSKDVQPHNIQKTISKAKRQNSKNIGVIVAPRNDGPRLRDLFEELKQDESLSPAARQKLEEGSRIVDPSTDVETLKDMVAVHDQKPDDDNVVDMHYEITLHRKPVHLLKPTNGMRDEPAGNEFDTTLDEDEDETNAGDFGISGDDTTDTVDGELSSF